MLLKDYRKKQANKRKNEIFEYWKKHSESVPETAKHFNICKSYVYKVLKQQMENL